jgi:hypothetical protein
LLLKYFDIISINKAFQEFLFNTLLANQFSQIRIEFLIQVDQLLEGNIEKAPIFIREESLSLMSMVLLKLNLSLICYISKMFNDNNGKAVLPFTSSLFLNISWFINKCLDFSDFI